MAAILAALRGLHRLLPLPDFFGSAVGNLFAPLDSLIAMLLKASLDLDVRVGALPLGSASLPEAAAMISDAFVKTGAFTFVRQIETMGKLPHRPARVQLQLRIDTGGPFGRLLSPEGVGGPLDLRFDLQFREVFYAEGIDATVNDFGLKPEGDKLVPVKLFEVRIYRLIN